MSEHKGVPPGVNLLYTLDGHEAEISRIAWSPDGQKLASASEDRTVRVWDAKTWKPYRTLRGHSAKVYSVAWSPDSRVVAADGWDGTVLLWNIATGEVIETFIWSTTWTGKLSRFGFSHAFRGVAGGLTWSPSNMLAWSSVHSIRYWDFQSKKQGKTKGLWLGLWPLPVQMINPVWSPDGHLLAAGSEALVGDERSSPVLVWRVVNGTLQFRSKLNGHREEVNVVSWSPDGSMLASGSNDKTIRLWDIATGREKKVIEVHPEDQRTANVQGICFSSDGHLVATYEGFYHEVCIWRHDSWERIATLPSFNSPYIASSFAFHPQLPLLATTTILPAKSVAIWRFDLAVLLGDASLTRPVLSTLVDGGISASQSHSSASTAVGVVYDQPEGETAVTVLQRKIGMGNFDVFLCHNSSDKREVKEIGNKLKERGILPWLDEWELRPGLPWQRLLEEQIEQIKSAAVFVGSEGIGPWQQQELEAYLREFVDRGCPVIPVLLPSASKEPELKPKLPVFLRGMTWVDFRKQEPDPLKRLIWGITGERDDLFNRPNI